MQNNKTKFDLQGKRILVTGASSGIGEATVRLLGEAGAVVGIHYHQRLKEAQTIKEEILSSGGVAEVFQANLSNAQERDTIIPAFIEKFGGLDGLVNNAGAPQGKHAFPNILKNEWDETFALNIEAPFFLSQQAFTVMQSQAGGKIVNVSSIGVKYGGSAKTIHYAMAKSALETLTVGMAKMGAEFNILVNIVRAGMTDTAFWQDKTKEEIEAREKLIPLKRIGKPQEVAETICFLLSHTYITGQTIAVSGGE
ncbi:MAG: SDR family oxidoreductase [Anaerolineales bacterium]|nr:SDR family oxidoreductase [Anaerolineales bacterium]